MKKNTVGLLLRIFAFLFKGKKYSVPRGGALANLGCGLRCLPGWINIDGSLTALFGSRKLPVVNRILYALAGSSAYYSFDEYNRIVREARPRFFDLRAGIPFKDEKIDVIFTSHFLEHLNKTDGRNFLRECHRVLKKGGLMRILVPDLDVAVALYQKGEVEKMLDLFFYTSDRYDFSAHKYNYNFEFLKKILEEIGFAAVERKKYQQGACPDIDFLDVYPDHSLYLECKKP